jgi:alpha-glucosidase
MNIRFTFLDPKIRYRALIYSDDSSVNTRTHVRIDRIDVNRNTVTPARPGTDKGIAMQIKPVK